MQRSQKWSVELQTQQKDEIEHRDNCIESPNTNKRETTAVYGKKESLETKMADLEGQGSLRFHFLCQRSFAFVELRELLMCSLHVHVVPSRSCFSNARAILSTDILSTCFRTVHVCT